MKISENLLCALALATSLAWGDHATSVEDFTYEDTTVSRKRAKALPDTAATKAQPFRKAPRTPKGDPCPACGMG